MHGQLGCVDKYKVTVFAQTRWGTHSLTTSIRALLKEAVNDVQNQRFVLLSEWDIPLYPPRVVYLQLMAEQASRIDACPGPMVCAPFLLVPFKHPKQQARFPHSALAAPALLHCFPCSVDVDEQACRRASFVALYAETAWRLSCQGFVLLWHLKVECNNCARRFRCKPCAHYNLSCTHQPKKLYWAWLCPVCLQFKMKPGRWRGNFLNTTFQFQHWRKAETWFSLIRHHAQAIIEDHNIEQHFAENCQHTDTNISRFGTSAFYLLLRTQPWHWTIAIETLKSALSKSLREFDAVFHGMPHYGHGQWLWQVVEGYFGVLCIQVAGMFQRPALLCNCAVFQGARERDVLPCEHNQLRRRCIQASYVSTGVSKPRRVRFTSRS